MKAKIGFFILMFVTIMGTAVGQTITSVPIDTGNDRFTTEYHSVIRPGLSLNGFDNSGSTSYGLGLKQVLNKALSGDTYTVDKLNLIFALANDPFSDPNPDNELIEDYSIILQYTAFEALASYVLEENNIFNPSGLNIRSHNVAMSDLRQKLIDISSYVITPVQGGTSYRVRDEKMVTHRSDYVKNVKSTQNIARAVDLYLALENAYEIWDFTEWNNSNSNILLTKDQKNELNITLKGAVERMYDALYKTHVFDVQEYEAEPGNRPLKGFLILGYAALSVQNPFEFANGSSQGNLERDNFDVAYGNGTSSVFDVSPVSHFNNAKDKASSPATNNNSTKYWMYQSDEGEKNWAEGPFYLDFALADAIPFWHAVRINGLLGGTPDPFKGANKWFLNPVEWLADLSTPNGYVPPIDDGNKSRLRITDLLRWSDTYGDATVGGKYATVYNNTIEYYGTSGTTYNFNNYQYLLDVSIPKRPTSSTTVLPNLTSISNQQFLQRYTDPSGNDHYFLFNKEYGNSITRGEGHEHPDQMQILYYINDDSYLVDTGYDAGDPKTNSFRIGYFYHNAMHHSIANVQENILNYVTHQNEGGLKSPEVSFSKARKVSEHPDVTDSFFTDVSSNVKTMGGSVKLKQLNGLTGPNQITWEGNLDRRVILVTDNDPFIIDFNKYEETNYNSAERLKMHYFGNSSELINKPTIEEWSYWDISHANNPIPGTSDAMNLYISALSEDPIREDRTYASDDDYDYSELEILEYTNSWSSSTGNKTPYPVKRKDYSKNNGNKKFGIITFLKADNSAPINSLTKLNVGADIHAGYYEHGIYRDVVVLRHSTLPSSPSSFEFDPGNSSSSVGLAPGVDYGYARFRKVNGQWLVDYNYHVNLLINTTVFTTNSTISSNETFSNTSIEVWDNVTLSIESTVNLDNVNVKLGEDAQIVVQNGGKLITNNNTNVFRLNPAKEHDGIYLKTTDNEINDTKISGGYFGLQIRNQGSGTTTHYINDSDIEDNVYGIFTAGSMAIHVSGSRIRNNSDDGIRLFSSFLYVDPTYTGSTKRTLFEGNGSNAIEALGYSTVNVYNSTFRNNTKHDIKIDIGARLYMGNYSSGSNWYGNNSFDGTTASSKYIHNLAMTGSGETATQWQVKAEKNYWDDGNAPSWTSDFIGSVDFTPHLTTDPVGGGAWKIGNFNNVASADQANNLFAEGFTAKKVDIALTRREQIKNLKDEIDLAGYDEKVAKLIRSYSGLVDISDKELLKNEAKELGKLRKKWFARFQFINNLEVTDSLKLFISEQDKMDLDRKNMGLGQLLSRPNRLKDIQATQTIGEVMVALELRQAIDNRDFTRVYYLMEKYGEYIKSPDLEYELLSYAIFASYSTKRYKLTLFLLNQLEEMQPEDGLLEYWDIEWEPADYTLFRQEIELLIADAAGIDDDLLQKKLEASIVDNVTEFKMHPAYPNPFNPSTIVSFDLPQQGKVRVDVYDISGRLVSVLANQDYQSGSHRLIFDASGLASGIYFVRANIAGNIQTQRITLIK